MCVLNIKSNITLLVESAQTVKTDNHTLKWQSTPLLEALTKNCEQCHSSCQSDAFVLLF